MEEDQEALKKQNCNIEETKIILEEWKTVVQTQMHFNEMIMRARTTGVSVVMAVYGAAALAYGQYPSKLLKICGLEYHVSAAIILFGIVLLFSIFFIDFSYFYKMLLASVERGEQIDKAYENRRIDGTRLFGMTTIISKKVSRTRSILCLIIFYGCPFLIGAACLVYLVWFYCPV